MMQTCSFRALVSVALIRMRVYSSLKSSYCVSGVSDSAAIRSPAYVCRFTIARCSVLSVW